MAFQWLFSQPKTRCFKTSDENSLYQALKLKLISPQREQCNFKIVKIIYEE